MIGLIAYLDRDQTYQFVNRRAEDWFNLPAERIIGRKVHEIIDRKFYDKFKPHVESVLEGNTEIFEEVVTYPDGAERSVEINYIPDVGEDGAVRGYFGLIVDISERKQAQEKLRESERRAVDAQSRLMDAIESIPEGFIMYDADERFVLCNSKYRDFYPQVEELLEPGSKLEDVARTVFERGAVVQTVDNVEEWMQIRLQEHRLAKGGHEQQLSDGRWLLCTASKTSGGDTVGIRTDISQLKQQEEQLGAGERLLQTVFDVIPHWVFVKDRNSRYMMVNHAFAESNGLQPEEFKGRHTVEMPTGTQAERALFIDTDRRVLESGERLDMMVYPTTLPDGTTRVSHMHKIPLRDDGENIVGLVGVLEDVTERVEAEAAVLKREEQLRAVIDNIPAAIFFKDEQGKYVLVNKVFESWCKLPAANIVGKMPRGIFESSVAKKFSTHDQLVLKHREIVTEEFSLLYPDGNFRTVMTIKFPVFDDQKNLIGVGAVGLDNTEQRKAEEELRTSESRYQTLASTVPVGIFRTDLDGRCLYVNERWCEISGFTPTQALGEGWTNAIHPEDREEVFKIWNESVRDCVTFRHEHRFQRPAGATAMVLCQAVAEYDDADQLIGYIGSVTDITERVRLEEQLRQSQKMEAVGQLAGGVAHDFNNMLQVVLSYAHIARSSLHTPENIPRYLDNIRNGAQRAANLTRQLLAFSRKDVLQPKILDVSELISNLMKMLGRLLGENIEMEILPGNDLKPVNADSGMLEQVLVNLSVNARDAMPDGGRLVIETSGFHADREFCKIHGWKSPGDFVLISVSDTGIGMTPEVREHIFDPFFTTKDAGKGTGLGMSMVYNIIEQHEGIIEIYSEPGVGSFIKIYLPTAKGDVAIVEEREVREVPGGTETILIAEDEESVRVLLSELLQGNGYGVLMATNGEEAVSKFKTHQKEIDLVVLDVVMPKLSGRDAYEQIRNIDGHVPIMFSTGYTASTLDREFLAGKDLKIIHKPYAPTVLFQTVREAIDHAAGDRNTRSA